MAIIIEFIRQYAPWVYGACALAALWYLRVVLLARRERRNAVFTLERETAMNQVYGAWSAAVVLLAIMGLIYLLSTVVSDAVQPLVAEQLVTPPPVETVIGSEPSVTPTLPVPDITPTHTATLRPRPTARPQPTLAPMDTPTPAPPRPSCPDARAVISAPGVGVLVSGMLPIMGTAVDQNFKFYKLEYAPGAQPDDSQWSYFDGADQPVQNGRLGTLNTGVLAPGTYSIRVEVVDLTGNHGGRRCQTVVVVR
jgi:hypothetical protein